MKLIASHKINRFGGIDNVNLPTDMEQVNDAGHAYYFAEAINFDMTNSRNMVRRDGYAVVHSFTSPHSLWSDEDDCFLMDGGTLYRINNDMSHSTLIVGLATTPMNYVAAYGETYFTNTVNIGRVNNNTVSSLTSATEPFKATMPAGHLIEFYNHCLYVAKGNIIYCSDPTILDQYDIRHGMIPFLSRITMLKAVEDGLWISDSENIYFLGGESFLGFNVTHKTAYPVVERSAAKIDGKHLGTDAIGTSVLMLTTEGICIGSNGGQFLCPTGERYHGSQYFVVHNSFIRISDNKYQYIIMGYDYQSGEAIHLATGFQSLESSSELNHTWALPLLQVNITATFL